MMKKIILVLVLITAVLAVVIQLQPATFEVTRSVTMNAPAEKIFEQVNNLHKWHAWSPWAKLDPNATETFSGPDQGEGAIMSWAGNHEVGKGSMMIASSHAPSQIDIDLRFVEPFEGKSQAQFLFQPEGEKTIVTWSMKGTNNFIGKAISLVMDCQKIVGTQFEQGLASLAKIVE